LSGGGLPPFPVNCSDPARTFADALTHCPLSTEGKLRNPYSTSDAEPPCPHSLIALVEATIQTFFAPSGWSQAQIPIFLQHDLDNSPRDNTPLYLLLLNLGRVWRNLGKVKAIQAALKGLVAETRFRMLPHGVEKDALWVQELHKGECKGRRAAVLISYHETLTATALLDIASRLERSLRMSLHVGPPALT
jgi:hypothetical protein